MNEHERIQARLAIYRDLNEAERQEVEAHLQGCPLCAARLAAYEEMDQALAALRQRDLTTLKSPQPGSALRRALSAPPEEHPPRWRHWLGMIPRLTQQAAALATLILLTVALITLFQGTESLHAPSLGAQGTVGAPLPPAPTPAPAASQRSLTLCTRSEPSTLLWSEPAYITSAILEAVQEPLIDRRAYGYQANLVEKLPSFEEGDAQRQVVTLSEGDRFYDMLGARVLTLTLGMTDSFALQQVEGEPLRVETWDGSPLSTVQVSARWTLVAGLSWQDGTPVTAADSLYAFELEHDPAAPHPRLIVQQTASYRALDERTLEWVGVPGYTDPTFFLNVWPPQPRHAYDRMSPAEVYQSEAANRAPLGYGPYQIDQWVAGEQITLSRNSHYFRGQPPLAQLRFHFAPSTEQLLASLLSGGCDVGALEVDWESILPSVRGLAEQGLLQVEMVPGTVFEHLDFNLRPTEGYQGAAATLLDNQGQPLFQNADFRRAVAHCLDREALIEQALNGAGFVQESYLPADHPLHPADATFTHYPFDPARGRALLTRLGWTDRDGDGLLEDAQGARLVLEHSTRQNPTRERVTQLIQAQLRANCGIETAIKLYGSEFFAEGPEGPLFGRQYDLGQFAWLVDTEPPCNLYLTSEIPGEENGWGRSNNSGFANTAFDAACEGARQATSEAEKAARHAEALRLFTSALPSIPLFARARITVVRPEVEGVLLDATSPTEMWNIENFRKVP